MPFPAMTAAHRSRTRQVLDSFADGTRTGTYIGIRSDISRSGVDDHLPASPERTRALAGLPTRLKRLDSSTINALVNWGYAAADAGLRGHLDKAAVPGTFPMPGSLVS